MKLIIEISEDVYEECQGHIYFPDTGGELFDAVKNGTPLDGTTNGEVMQTLFPYAEVVGGDEVFTGVRIDTKGTGTPIALYTDWWNAPYQKEREE